jgi:demethylmenaquinone methyltransferase/2-methoxy-6-polyprenyl-1,4-benzoquinol methylase
MTLSERDPRQVRSMFDRIAPRYDLVNTLLSVGADARWRRRAARTAVPSAGGKVLDIACGSGKLSGDLARLAGPRGEVVGLDFSRPMLQLARKENPRLGFLQGDALDLPFEDGRFDATTIAFGLRNLSDPVRGLAEMIRVLRPGGTAVVLEFVRPPAGPVGSAYRLYLRRMLPLIGGRVSGDVTAYRYLSQTVDSYRTPAELRAMAAMAGWRDIDFQLLTLGTVGLMSGRRET